MIGVGAAARKISPRFASVSVARSAPSTVSPERAAEVSAKAERVTAKAEAHFEKHRQLWTNRQYGQLLARDGERMAFRPNGMVDDRKAHLMRAADHLVNRNHASRLAGINRAAEKLLAGEKLESKNKDIGRG